MNIRVRRDFKLFSIFYFVYYLERGSGLFRVLGSLGGSRSRVRFLILS